MRGIALTRRELAIALALLAGGLAVRLAICNASHSTYVFAGSDSYGYVKLADNFLSTGRYAIAPEPEPLHWARMPLYPLFIAAVKGGARADMGGGEGWQRLTRAQLWLDLLVTGLCVWAIGRRLGGRRAGLVALGLAMFVPFTLVQVTAALSETLATALATATLALLMLVEKRRWAVLAAGALIGLSTLVRPDGLLLVLALPAALLAEKSWRERALLAALAVAGFAIAYGPWPIRNQLRFGEPHWLGGRVDRHCQPLPFSDGEHHFLASFGADWRAFNSGTACVMEGLCNPPLDRLEGAASTAEEHARVQALQQRRQREGMTRELSDAFEAEARARRSAHPLRAWLWLPLRRATSMWLDSFDEVFQHPPLPAVHAFFAPVLPAMAVLLALALLVGGAGLAALSRERALAAIALTAIAGRTAVLALAFFCMPRYLREVQPVGYAISAAGLATLAGWLVQKWRGRMAPP